ncbi:MAG TPA: adenylosuccinate synthetase [Kribbella sp.]
MPKNAQTYVRAVESLSGAPISAVGVGPERSQIVMLDRS